MNIVQFENKYHLIVFQVHTPKCPINYIEIERMALIYFTMVMCTARKPIFVIVLIGCVQRHHIVD